MTKIIKKLYRLLAENKDWIKTSFLIFLISLILGIISFFIRELPTSSLISDSLSKIAELGSKAKASDFWGRFSLIYKNNLLSMAVVLFGGMFFGLFTLIGLFVNGLLLGFFFLLIFFVDLDIFSKFVLFLLLLPHGIIELSLLIISGSWGLKLGFDYLLPKNSGKRLSVFINNLKSSFWIFVLLAVGLAVAAIVEVIDMKILEFLVR